MEENNTAPQDENQIPLQEEHTGFTALIPKYPVISQHILNSFNGALNQISTKINRYPESAESRVMKILEKELEAAHKELDIPFNTEMFEVINKPQSLMSVQGHTNLEAHLRHPDYQSRKGLRGEQKAVFEFLELYRKNKMQDIDFVLLITKCRKSLGIPNNILRQIRGRNRKSNEQKFEIYLIHLYYLDQYAHALKKIIDERNITSDTVKSELHWRKKKGDKINLVRTLIALHDMYMIEDKNGNVVTQEVILREFGRFLNIDLSSRSSISNAIERNPKVNTAFFKKMIEKIEKRCKDRI